MRLILVSAPNPKSKPTVRPEPSRQMHFIEGPAYKMDATATATGRGFTKEHYRKVEKAKSDWGETAQYDIGHPKDQPFATQRPGQKLTHRLERANVNSQAGALSKAEIGRLRAAGIPVRDPPPPAVEAPTPPAVPASPPLAPSPATPSAILEWAKSPEKMLEFLGYGAYAYQMAHATTPAEAMNTTTNFMGATVGRTLGGGVLGGAGMFLAGPGGAAVGEAAGQAVGATIGSYTTEIVEDTDWKEVAFVGLMGLACLL